MANGIKPEIHEGEYALFYEELVFDDGTLANFAPDIVYLHTSMRNIKVWPVPGDDADTVAKLAEAEAGRFITAAQAGLKLGCPVILNNFELPPYRVMGNREGSAAAGKVRFVRKLNELLADFADSTPNVYLNDLCYLQAQHGMDAFSDQTAWYAYKYPCALDKLPYLAQSVANIIKSLLGKNKKALALDLDNTLWGGVIGDDGPGMAYMEFQQYLKELSAVGVLLNVNSKNEMVNAEAGFKRADSVLKKEDFICFKANWEPKSHNIVNMAKEINIFPDSFVFVDDNPAEREIVRQQVTGVAVPELGAPEDYIKSIDRSGYFEVTNLSADDQKRVAMYKQNAQRAEMQASFGDYSEYLRSLEMTGDFGAFDAPHAERITQLINKSNQFNLTTRRYTAAEVEGLIGDENYVTLYGRLVDKFGDNGIVSIVIGHVDGDVMDMDLWVMSCRVLKRDMEKAMFDCLCADAAAKGVKTIRGHYYPTAKNLLVKDFYATIGFEQTSVDEAGNKEYVYHIPADRKPQCSVMEVRRV